MYPSFQFFSQMGNLTVVSPIYWPLIAGNLSVVSILLSNVKSHHYFNAFLALYCRQSIHRFSFFFSNGKSNRCFNNFLASIAGNVSVVSILFSNGKSNRCCNNFFALHCKNLSVVSIPLSHGNSNRMLQQFFRFAL